MVTCRWYLLPFSVRGCIFMKRLNIFAWKKKDYHYLVWNISVTHWIIASSLFPTIFELFLLFRNIWDAFAMFYHLYNFKKHEKQPWRSVTFSNVAGVTKSSIPPWVLFMFFKLYKWYKVAQSIKASLIYFTCMFHCKAKNEF